MKAFLVGGAVRDKLMGVESNDRDWVVVGRTPQEMLDAGFTQVGQSFPVFLHPETGDEWALARTERKTGAGYGGFAVDTQNVTLEQDLSRRDLTINSIAWDPETGQLVDPFFGQEDLKNKVLRHTSEAFSEDPLRVVRLARFYARYTDFSVAVETFNLATGVVLSGEMDAIPAERFVKEFEKVFTDSRSDVGRFLEMLHMMGVFYCVNFFKRIFTFRSLRDIRMMGVFVEDVKRKFPEADTATAMAAMLYTATTYPDELVVFGSDVRDAVKTTEQFMTLTKLAATPEAIVAVLRKCRSTRGLSSHAQRALVVVESISDGEPVRARFVDSTAWRKYAMAVATVDVEPLVAKFSGKELGDEIHKAMMDKVREVL